MKKGNRLERDVQRIYSSLLNMKDEGVVVGNSVFMTGKSGEQHEIDVYYEFSKAGIKHRVAIECKDWSKPVCKGRVQEFESKIRDIGNIIGVIVSRNGYQSGADGFARFHDILPLKFDDLPSINSLLADRLMTISLPEEDYVGEPFWVIMEIRDKKVTGSHFVMKCPTTGKQLVPLTYCKFHAQRVFNEAKLDSSQWAVRGLPRFALKAFLITLELYEKKMNTGAIILYLPPGAEPDAEFVGFQAPRETLIREYYGKEIPSIEDAKDD